MPTVERAIKYRIYPSREQELVFAKTFGCCRKIYNLMLSDKVSHYETFGKTLRNTPAMYKDQYPFLREVDSLALAYEQRNLETAFKSFFRNKKVGFPKFKSAKRDRRSYKTYNVNNCLRFEGRFLRLPKVGLVKIKIHRTPKAHWVLKSACISKDPDGKYYAALGFQFPRENHLNASPLSPDKVLGLDYKSDGLYVDSNGNSPDVPQKFFRQSQRKLAKAQRQLSRKKPGSQNYKKQKKKVASIHKKIANQRKDFLHKESLKIANSSDYVCVENLSMKAIANKSFRNGKATFDNAYRFFVTCLDYKLSDRGKKLVVIDKWFPSTKACSACGKKQDLKLSERIYHCPCGNHLDRDLNAAINIRNEGIRMLKENHKLGWGPAEVTPVDIVSDFPGETQEATMSEAGSSLTCR